MGYVLGWDEAIGRDEDGSDEGPEVDPPSFSHRSKARALAARASRYAIRSGVATELAEMEGRLRVEFMPALYGRSGSLPTARSGRHPCMGRMATTPVDCPVGRHAGSPLFRQQVDQLLDGLGNLPALPGDLELPLDRGTGQRPEGHARLQGRRRT